MKSVWSDETGRRINKVTKISSCVLLTSLHLKKKIKKINKKFKKRKKKFTGFQLKRIKWKIHFGSLVDFDLVTTPPPPPRPHIKSWLRAWFNVQLQMFLSNDNYSIPISIWWMNNNSYQLILGKLSNLCNPWYDLEDITQTKLFFLPTYVHGSAMIKSHLQSISIQTPTLDWTWYRVFV